jgi:hypothetical protein
LRPIDYLVRAEWVAVFAVAVGVHVAADGGWLLFFLLILAPDIFMLGYLAGPRVGAAAYNLVHVLFGPLALFAAGFMGDTPLAMQVAAIWLAHIAIDRACGYGLKLPTGFRDTHLGHIGRD